MADLWRKAKSLFSTTSNSFSTGEGETITPVSISGLPTDTEITLTFDRVDSTGVATPSLTERIIGTISGSDFVISSGGRGADGTSEQAHTSPVVEYIWNAEDWNDAVDSFLTEHAQDGTHLTTKVLTLTGTQTSTNKTFTAPVLTSPVVKSYDGWITASNTWTYASATSFTIAGTDLTSTFVKGTKIKLTQTTAKYFYVTSSSFSTDTTVNITGGSDFTVANAAITTPFYSYEESPQGFPQYFTWAPSFGGFSSAPSGTFKFAIKGNSCHVNMYIATPTASNATTYTFTLPVVSLFASPHAGYSYDNGSWVGSAYGETAASSSTFTCTKTTPGSSWTASGNKMWVGNFVYTI